ncbi:MAG: tRNA lysidine(34) synthetase TilS [Dehalococcoidia bacterium]
MPSLKHHDLSREVQRIIKGHHLIPRGEAVVVGVSGGPDSVCLVHILAGLRERLGMGLHVAHLNHLLRGPESEADADYVSQLAQRLSLPFTVESQAPHELQLRRGLSPEEAAREVRYGFLARVAAATGARRIAVGHTASDQAETVLMHLVRGSGLRGLGGMAPAAERNGLTLIRPLLSVSREETESYCRSHHLQPRQDSSNLSPDHLRNRFRRELLPLLRSFNPNIEQTLLRSARTLSEDLAFLQEGVSRAWAEVVTEEGGGIALDVEMTRRLHPALQRHLLLQALEHMLGSPQDALTVHVEQMLAVLTRAGKKLSLPGGLTFSAHYGKAVLSRGGETPCPLPPLEGSHRLRVPGETVLPGWRVEASLGPPSGLPGAGWKASFDLEATGSNLVVRKRRPGDRFQPLGLGYEKKLQDFMVDAKIQREWRARVPLVCSDDHIIWVAGWRTDERTRVRRATRRVLSLEFERLEDRPETP